jgi:hypothetical protein
VNSRFVQFAGFCALWICTATHAASVRAWLDRSSMQLGETVTLNVEVSGDTGAAQPDLTALAQDFDLLGTQSSTSVNIINGQTSSKLLWAVGLQPKREGTLTIPALAVAGQQTTPLTLSVQPATASAANGSDVYVEATAEPRAPYVQEQVRLTVKLYYSVNLLDGSLADPQLDGLTVRKLGQDASYVANISGRTYHVVERHYALTAERSGAATLPAIAFRGHAAQGNSIDIFFNRGREIGARSAPIELNVRPRPAASGSDAWLPARSLTLSASGLDAASTARAGEPMTLTLRMQAQGLAFEQLPELKLPTIEGVDIYPDKSSTQNRNDGEWLFGERERKFAIVPRRSGALTLPAISVGWWDTAHDRAETASLSALTLDVQPAAGAPGSVPQSISAPVAASPDIAAQPAPTAASHAAAADDDSRFWRTLAVVIALLWIMTIATAWLLVVRRRDPTRTAPPAPNFDQAPRKAFKDACRREDYVGAARSLLAWARQTRPDLRNLGELRACIRDSGQRAAIEALERCRYGHGNVTPTEMLAEAFRKDISFDASIEKPTRADVLPPLYPFQT